MFAVDTAGAKRPQAVGRLADWSKLTEKQRYQAWVTSQKKRVKADAPSPDSLTPSSVKPLAYRPLDFRAVYDDPAWVDWWREDLHLALTAAPVQALVTIPRDHGAGPVAFVVDKLMDQHVFNNRGGNGVWLLWHPLLAGADPDPRGVDDERRSGLSSTVLDWMDAIGRAGRHQEAFDYIIAVLNAPSGPSLK